jgi:broad specificity phosphatase PhoE
MIEVVLIRHGECGALTLRDCRLTKKGVVQSSDLKGTFDAIYVSPLWRAIETLAASKMSAPEVIVMSLVREKREDPCDFRGDEREWREADEQVHDRATQFLDVVRSSGYRRVAVVSHCEFIFQLAGVSLYHGQSTSLRV